MNEKWNIFDENYYKIDKYSSKIDKYSSYDKYNKLLKELGSFYEIDNLLGGYTKNSDWVTYKPKKYVNYTETPKEKEERLLIEKAKVRETKIDLILKK